MILLKMFRKFEDFLVSKTGFCIFLLMFSALLVLFVRWTRCHIQLEHNSYIIFNFATNFCISYATFKIHVSIQLFLAKNFCGKHDFFCEPINPLACLWFLSTSMNQEFAEFRVSKKSIWFVKWNVIKDFCESSYHPT